MTHPVIKELFAEMERRKINPQVLGRMASVNPSTLRSWKFGLKAKSQTFERLDKCWRALGYELKPVKRKG